MNLVKWIRKNEHRLMVWLLVLIMIAFVGGSALTQILRSINIRKTTVAHYSGGKITGKTLGMAQRELELLKDLKSDQFLINQTFSGRPDFRSMLLGQVLFPESFRGEQLSYLLKQSIVGGQRNLDENEINEFFVQLRKSLPRKNWLLLKAEAEEAGCVVSIDEAKSTLSNVITMMSGGQMKTGALISGLVQKYGLTEDKILSIYADMIAVMKYSKMVTNSENLTIDQIKTGIAMSGGGEIVGEQINAEYVKVSASRFTKNQPDPSDLELNEQFTKYKGFDSRYLTEGNPYGFGYKLPAMVDAQYIVVKLDDVKNTVSDPTDDEMMDYYNSNSAEFTMSTPVDPKDPTGATVDQKQSYSKVAGRILTTLKRSKANRKADMIIAEAVEKTTANYGDLEVSKATSDELKDLAVDYAKIADELTAKHGVQVYTGTTGLISASDLSSDQVFRYLSIQNRGSLPQSITKLLFATEGLEVSKLGPFDRAVPKKWENLGPAKSFSHVAIVRAIDTAQAKVPDNINYTYSINKTSLDKENTPTVVSIKDEVIEDLKLLKSMEAAKAAAEELAELAGDKEFKEAVDAFNSANKDKGVILFSQKMTDKTRKSKSDLKASFAQQAARNPAMGIEEEIPASIFIPNMLVEKFYSLVASDENELKDINKVMLVEPEASYYVIKDVSRKQVSIQDYEKSKALNAFISDYLASEALTLHHFRVDNIQKRMDYKVVERKEKDDETEEGTN